MDDAESASERRFLELLESHGPRLRRIAGSYARGAERDDLYQEILCQLWRSLPSFRGESGTGTWAYRVALNTALTHARRRGRRPREVAPPPDSEPASPASAGDPARQDALLEDFLASLGEMDRSLLVLYLDGLNYDGMAEVTGMSSSAVGVRLHRIKRAYARRYLGSAE